MRRFFVNVFAIIGFFTFLIILALGWTLYRVKHPSLPLVSQNDKIVLSLTLGDSELEEKTHAGGLAGLIKGHPMSVHTVISAIYQAAQDNQIKGIFLNLEGNALKIATVQEIREAFKAFKDAGKFIYTYTDTFGDFTNGTGAYYLAASTSKIWVMPLGEFNFNGILVEVPFGKKILDTFKLHPQMGRREEYKGMVESLTQEDFTQPYRQNMQRIIDGLITQVINDVAADRHLKADDVRDVLNTAPHTLKETMAAKMIDELGYKDQVKEAIEKQLETKPTYHDFETYAHAHKDSSRGDKIAIIYAEGTISKGKMVHNPLTDDAMMDAIEVAKSIREAGEDKQVKAIVLRIDSGGGYPIPCELIDREVERVKSKKPLIVSMANYAASGGYWIACNARKIVAQPATLTGSIGVYAGKMVTQEFWGQYGLHWGEVHSGNNAQIWSTGKEFSDIGRQKFEEYLDKIYSMFQEKVAKGRNMTPQAVHTIAKGQVWTGREAKENGLVDELGGLMTAIALAKKEAGLAPDASIGIAEFPAAKSIFEMIFERNQPSEIGIFSRYPLVRAILQQLDGLFTSPKVEVKMNPSYPH